MPDTPITWTNCTRKLSDLIEWVHNPRQITEKQGAHLQVSIRKFGFAQPFLISPENDIYDGHQRKALMGIMQEYGYDAEIDCRVSSRMLTEDEQDEFVIRLRENTGEYDWDILANHFEVEKLTEWGFPEWKLDEFMPEEYDSGVTDGAQPNPRNLPIDVIYTLQMADCTCCLAVQAGLKYGIQSAHYRLCPYVGQLSGRHKVEFIDNDYFDYDHAVHLKAVKELRPKYATVMDVMTEKQCRKDKITHYELGRILDWAEELSEYAENVIVIPKYDCLDKIPEKYILGYSVPTSHGGTPLSVDLFRGRRVHLLGGSWKKQLSYMAALGDDVVSLDNNYVARVASEYGGAIDQNGNSYAAPEFVNNIRYTSLAISFGAIGAKVNQLYGNNIQEANE